VYTFAESNAEIDCVKTPLFEIVGKAYTVFENGLRYNLTLSKQSPFVCAPGKVIDFCQFVILQALEILGKIIDLCVRS
jgi:hypothetical protein